MAAYEAPEPAAAGTSEVRGGRHRTWLRPLLAAVLALGLVLGVIALVRAASTDDTAVPPVLGKPLATAEDALASKGLTWSVVHLNRGTPNTRLGVVLLEHPLAGSNVAKGSTVQLNVFGLLPGVNGPTVRTPNLVGMVQWIALNAIADRGLTPVVIGPPHHGSGYQYWKIVSQSPRAGTVLRVGQGSVVIHMRP